MSAHHPDGDLWGKNFPMHYWLWSPSQILVRRIVESTGWADVSRGFLPEETAMPSAQSIVLWRYSPFKNLVTNLITLSHIYFPVKSFLDRLS